MKTTERKALRPAVRLAQATTTALTLQAAALLVPIKCALLFPQRLVVRLA